MFSAVLTRLEKATGHSGIDVRLTADVISRAHAALRALGLDPQDTTGPELYHGLVGLAARHDHFLASRLGIQNPSSVSESIHHIREILVRTALPGDIWAIKFSVMKRLLKAQPPRVAQKALGYRSLDSMLKREPVTLVLAAAYMTESEKWQRAFSGSYAKLQPVDFESRQLEIYAPTSTRWNKLAEAYIRRTRHNLTHLRELGAVVILPLPVESLRGVTLTLLPQVIHNINEIKIFSSYFKLMQVRSDFGVLVRDAVRSENLHHVQVLGLSLHWNMLFHHFNNTGVVPEAFEPHLTKEDFDLKKPSTFLYKLEPALHFWHDIEYVGKLTKEGPVSLSLGDVSASLMNNLPYAHRTVHHMREKLNHEIHQRYIAHPTYAYHILRQLETAIGGYALTPAKIPTFN